MNAEGSVFIATSNDNAVGMYTCTAYNSYGTMGKSESTQVLLQVRLGFFFSSEENSFTVSAKLNMDRCNKAPSLRQDPPSLRVPPQPEYLQEVGRQLIIPCEANGDPNPNITWSKVQEEILDPKKDLLHKRSFFFYSLFNPCGGIAL